MKSRPRFPTYTGKKQNEVRGRPSPSPHRAPGAPPRWPPLRPSQAPQHGLGAFLWTHVSRHPSSAILLSSHLMPKASSAATPPRCLLSSHLPCTLGHGPHCPQLLCCLDPTGGPRTGPASRLGASTGSAMQMEGAPNPVPCLFAGLACPPWLSRAPHDPVPLLPSCRSHRHGLRDC